MAAPGYTTREVAELLDLSVEQVRSYIRAGLVDAERGPRREYRISFQSMVLLRTARDLVGAKVPRRRVRRALRELQAALPQGRSLSALQIRAEGADVVVHDGSRRWDPASGQLHFNFEVGELARQAAPIARRRAEEARALRARMQAEDWYDLGCDLEAPAPGEAEDAYRRALELDPEHVDAHVNLGRLLHESGSLAEAESHYRTALRIRPRSAIAAFNLGVVLEDRGQETEALRAYEIAVASDPGHADAYHNAASICERRGDREAAIRYLQSYRRLVR